MNDRELLELAAKAAGIGPLDFDYCEREGHDFYFGPRLPMREGVIMAAMHTYWDPQRNDSDAMGIAVALGMTVDFDYADAGLPNCVAVYLKGGERRYPEHYCGTFPDRAKNARFAILSAAERVGKAMP
jgi:hypothetical protein